MKLAYKIFLLVFSILWVGFIVLDYLQKHPAYILNFNSFEYFDLITIVLMSCFGVAFLIKKNPQKNNYLQRGIFVFLFSLLLVSLSYIVGVNRVSHSASVEPISLDELLHMQFLFAKISIYLLLIFTATFAAGNLFLKKIGQKFSKSSYQIIDIAVGILLLVSIAFILGVFKILFWFTLGPICLLILLLNRQESIAFLKSICWNKFKLKSNYNLLGLFCFLLLAYLIGFNLLQNLTPWPKGWDSLSLYVNLPNLIHDNHSLVKGFQPYNWSLFMSFGLILFNSIETTLALSYMGGVLCLYALYHLGIHALKLDVNHSLLAVLVFYLVPSVNFQSFLEQKVDLGLLFIVLVILIIVLEWAKKKNENKVSWHLKDLLQSKLIIAGLLTGFAFGIKLTTLFTFFGVIAVIWCINFGRLAFLGMSLLSIAGILILKLDDMSGMRKYHLSSNVLQWIILLVGLALLSQAAYKQKDQIKKTLLQTVIYGFFFIVPVIPWLVKNYVDSGNQLSFNYLLNGKSDAPIYNAKEFEKNWQKKIQDGK